MAWSEGHATIELKDNFKGYLEDKTHESKKVQRLFSKRNQGKVSEEQGFRMGRGDHI